MNKYQKDSARNQDLVGAQLHVNRAVWAFNSLNDTNPNNRCDDPDGYIEEQTREAIKSLQKSLGQKDLFS